MARLVLHEAQRPAEVKVGAESKWVCMCGLTRNAPFCDGSHKKTLDEENGKTYKYESSGRKVVA
ncbi:MAG: CDGSH iron-sulfur domain-containing protein [Candidatus Aenigmarchaeota archaeon]|nr:CDGSH iron-sulfur domain-containing protein [Candidatus Aenigmarchaeota archaeon]